MSLPTLLISTDFDGTLLDHQLPAPLAPEFFDWIEVTRKTRRVVWVINTGRDWASLDYELNKREARFLPDWVVLVEREIHRLGKSPLQPLECWNQKCQTVHRDLFMRAEQAIDNTRKDLARFSNLQIITDIGSPLGLIADSDKQADEVQIAIQPLLDDFPEMHSVRNSVYFRFAHVDFHKGSCLLRIAEEEGVPLQHRFAAGDHFNDLPMLDRRIAYHMTCPANAVPEVKERVRQHGGHVSDLNTHHGVVEGLRHCFPSTD
jgi:hydroxymethylpyrimidine pyrophosphatase-like HAD family hydrolase